MDDMDGVDKMDGIWKAWLSVPRELLPQQIESVMILALFSKGDTTNAQ